MRRLELVSDAPRARSAPEDARFRDPPSVEEHAARLRSELARILVAAPSLPVELPAAQLALVDVHADRRGIDLLLGPSDPVARLRITMSDAASVAVSELHPAAQRYQRILGALAARVERSITKEKWARARAVADELITLPSGVPLGYFRQIVAGVEPLQGLVRTGFRCNQDCGMCWQARDWGRYGPEQILVWIDDLRALGASSLIISGGEPTLDPELPRYIEHARSIGLASITLETNAIQMAKPGNAQRLRDAGLTTAFVSLHSGDADVSDAITRAPGTHARTVLGVRALLDAGVPVVLNAVMTGEGIDRLGALPDFVHDTFGPHPLLRSLMISYPTEPFDRALVPEIVPEPARLRAALREAIDRALALGIRVRGLDGPCGPPLCAFGADPRITELRPVPGQVDFRLHVAACDRCVVKHVCFGVRSVDVDRYGEACVEPIAEI